MTTKIFLGSLALTLALAPIVPVMAQGTDIGVGANANANIGLGALFCTRIANVSVDLLGRIGTRETKFDSNRDNRTKQIADRKANQNKRLADLRTTQNSDRDAQYARLDVRATTDVQKQAVADFKATISAGITTRRAGVDKAVADFRTALDAAVTTRKSSVDTAIATFKASVQAAFDKAAASCNSGTDPKTARATLQVDLKAARDKFQSDRTTIDKVGAQFNALVTTRRAAIQAALDAFKATAEQARIKLKAAFAVQVSASASGTAQ